MAADLAVIGSRAWVRDGIASGDPRNEHGDAGHGGDDRSHLTTITQFFTITVWPGC
jgi:hypothetical protein